LKLLCRKGILPLMRLRCLRTGARTLLGGKMDEHEAREKSMLLLYERHILTRIIERMPQWITPDVLTYTSLLASFAILPTYWMAAANPAWVFAASFLLIVHWFTDSTDGGLAIYRKQPRPRYGHYVDHSFDMIMILMLGLGLGISGILAQSTAVALIIILYLFSLHSAFVGQIKGVYQIAYLGFGMTEGRLLVILLQTSWFLFPGAAFLGIPVAELAARGAIGVMAAALLVLAVRTIVQLKREDEQALRKRR
jgi:archaetidylinositol phosphate synthase